MIDSSVPCCLISRSFVFITSGVIHIYLLGGMKGEMSDNSSIACIAGTSARWWYEHGSHELSTEH